MDMECDFFGISIKSLPYLLVSYLLLISCKKMVDIPPPANSITTAQVFADSADAAAAVSGIYATISQGYSMGCLTSGPTVLFGMTSDELIPFLSNVVYTQQFYYNDIFSGNSNLASIWSQPYNLIYQANACIEGLKASSLNNRIKDQFIGECLFLRSLVYFNLINAYGDVPFVTGSSWQDNQFAGRISTSIICDSLIVDLQVSKKFLLPDYSFSGNNRVRANKFCANALLAKVYLFEGDSKSARDEADTVINCGLYSLLADPNKVFLTNSNESILQWQLNTAYGTFNATPEGSLILPLDSLNPPAYFLSKELLSAFEQGDLRRLDWVGHSNYNGIDYYYPYKYKVPTNKAHPGNEATEYSTILRLAEQYLIRSEARLSQGDLTGSIIDLNTLRKRANIDSLPLNLSPNQINSALDKENRIEYFSEGGNRWFYLKRRGEIDSVMQVVLPLKNPGSRWNPVNKLMPIPSGDIILDRNLSQTPGYY